MEEDRIENGGPAGPEEQPVTEERSMQKPDEEQVIEPENALPEVTLQELPESLRAACGRAGWTKLLPVQARAIPYVLAGRNVMVQSQTGSGMTSCVFGGAEMNELFITSARLGMDTAAMKKYPQAGGVFKMETNVTGMPTFEFGS